jgi:hypothetical protein
MEQKEEMISEEVKYYRDYMAIKSDATSILHNMDDKKFLFLYMCQELTHRICRKKNAIFNYVHDRLIPQMFDLQYDDEYGLLIIDDQLAEFIRKNTIKYEEYVNIFLKIRENVDEATPDEIEIYSGLFYKFYLKGGSAMKFIFNSYKEQIGTFSLTSDEEKTFLGDNSDYDFDFLINENIEKTHYDELSRIATHTILDFLYEIIINYSSDLFNDDIFINDFINKLKENKPHPLNPVIKVSHIIKGNINEHPILVSNDGLPNKIGIVTCNPLHFEHPFSEEGKEEIKFYLLRLMLKFINDVYLENYEYPYNKIYAEIIDVCVPIYESYDRKTKWEQSINNIKINEVYCYNLNSIIKDLEGVIDETRKTDNPDKKKKLGKRINRLNFFKNLICIIPRLIYKEEDSLVKKTGIPLKNYKTICEQIIDTICPSEKIF